MFGASCETVNTKENIKKNFYLQRKINRSFSDSPGNRSCVLCVHGVQHSSRSLRQSCCCAEASHSLAWHVPGLLHGDTSLPERRWKSPGVGLCAPIVLGYRGHSALIQMAVDGCADGMVARWERWAGRAMAVLDLCHWPQGPQEE